MRMLMGANGIYADGKAQPMPNNGQFDKTSNRTFSNRFFISELTNEASNKRAASPHDKGQSLEYLIRSELDRACPTMAKPEGKLFH